MPVTCPGCGEPFKRSGLANHIRQSNDPLCRLPYGHKKSNSDPGLQDTMDDIPPMPNLGPAVISIHESEPQNKPPESSQLGVDPLGDVFGDYANYIDADFGIGDAEEQDIDEPSADEDDLELLSGTQDDSEEEDMVHEALLAEEEQQLEPERPQQLPGTIGQELEHNDDLQLPSHQPFRLRGRFEEPLANRPEIINFSVGNAGAAYARTHHNGNRGYRQFDNGAVNQYEPFSSKLDWEIACWAKTRGPGSNALTELLSIDGVSFCGCAKRMGLTNSAPKVVEHLGLSYKNAAELNKLIDQELPGRPSFQRHEVMVGTEVCDVYFRDVIACIKALFADPDLAPYLVTTPEKHFTYNTYGGRTRMYHDMHTGKWWWETQVSRSHAHALITNTFVPRLT